MKRLSLFLALLIAIMSPLSTIAQASRYRMPTKADDSAPAPSFRGGERKILKTEEPGQGQGRLNIPQMPSGMSTPAGSTMGEAAMVSLGYQVHVLGEVMKPGTYRVVASDRVSEVIERAGGLVENSSERNIELRRKGGSVSKVDLFAFKILGKLDQNPYVTDNDTVFVPLQKNVIQVVGAVKRPAFYELTNEKTLKDIVELGGGFNAATDLKDPIRVIRFEDGKKKIQEVSIEDDTMKKFEILTGDIIVVPNVVTKDTKFDYNVASIPGDQVFYPSYEDRVFVLGGVAFPGAYPFSPYYTVNQYISLAGGLNERGKQNFKVVSLDGKKRKIKAGDRVNPGDTIAVKQSWMSPASWMGFIMGVASFGLSASATIIAIRK